MRFIWAGRHCACPARASEGGRLVKVCTVIGRVIATSKHPSLQGRTLLLLVARPGRGDPAEAVQVAVDSVGARPGDEVLVTESGAAGRQVTGWEFPPVRSVIVGIVD